MACVVFRRALKRIELSRGVRVGQGYGNCKRRSDLERVTAPAVGGLDAGDCGPDPWKALALAGSK